MDVAYYLAISRILALSIVILDAIADRVARLEITSVLEKLGDFLLLISALWLYGGLFYLDFKWPWLNALGTRLVIAFGIYSCHKSRQLDREIIRIVIAREMLDD